MARLIFVITMLLLSSCNQPLRPIPGWSQYRGDEANSGQKLIPSYPAVTIRHQELVLPGGEIAASPVIMPDGSIIVSTFDPIVPGRAQSALHILSSGNMPQPEAKFGLSGQFSSAAVDDSGNIFVIHDPPGEGDWFLISLNSQGQLRWWKNIKKNVGVISPPKLIRNSSGTLIFLQTGTSKISVFNDNGDEVFSQFVCSVVEGGEDFEFTIDPVELPPPRFEDPTPGLATFEDTGPDDIFVAMPINRCGVFFFRVDFDDPVVAPRLYPSHSKLTDSIFSSAVVAANGTTLVGTSEGQLLAFDIRTGDEIWRPRQLANSGRPDIALLPLRLNFAFVLAGSELRKIDLSDGTDVVPPVTVEGAMNVFASASYVHVTSAGGISTYDFELSRVNMIDQPLVGRPPALGPEGQLYLAGPNATLHVFHR